MQLFEEISILLSEEKTFVCYVKPNESIWNLQVQQTPNPLAHDPAEVPPLFVHSELKKTDKSLLKIIILSFGPWSCFK